MLNIVILFLGHKYPVFYINSVAYEIKKWKNSKLEFTNERLTYFTKFTIQHVKFRYYEKATKFEKISHLFWQNSCFYSVASKTSGRFFQIFMAFSEKLNFIWQINVNMSNLLSQAVFLMSVVAQQSKGQLN